MNTNSHDLPKSRKSGFAQTPLVLALRKAFSSRFISSNKPRHELDAKSGENTMRFESLEPRILLSADLYPAVQGSVLDLQNSVQLNPEMVQKLTLPSEAAPTINLDIGTPSGMENPVLTLALDTESLNPTDIQPLVGAAINRLGSLGFTSEQLSTIEGTEISITDLPGTELGLATDNHVWIDKDAGGYGWFVDKSPMDDAEFSAFAGKSLQVQSGSPAAGKVDLLTVLAHEFGHLLGLDHTNSDSQGDVLMEAGLRPGVRRTPAADGDALVNVTVPSVDSGDFAPSMGQMLQVQPTISWVGNTDGFWDDPGNWLDSSGVSRLPTATDDVLIDNLIANPSITIRSGTQLARSLVINEKFVLSGGSLTVTGDLQVENGNSFLLSGGKLSQAHVQAGATLTGISSGGTLDGLTLAGTVLAASGMTVTGGLKLADGGLFQVGDGHIWGDISFNGDQTIDGPGEIRFVGQKSFGTTNRLRINNNITFGPSLTVRGSSGDFVINGSLTNSGTITADGGGELTIGFNGESWANAAGGRLSADGGTLTLLGNWANAGQIAVTDAAGSTLNLGGNFTAAGLGSYTRSGGVINLTGVLDNSGNTLTLNAATGSWNLAGGTLRAGTLRTMDEKRLEGTTSGGIIDGLTVVGTVFASGMTVTGGLTLAEGSLFQIGDANRLGDVSFNGDQTIDGPGEIRFAGQRSFGVANRMRIINNVTFGPSLTVRGGSGDFVINGTLTNQGTISSEKGDIGFDFGTNGTLGSWVNAGSLLVNNAILNLGGNFSFAPGSRLRNVGGVVNILGTLDNTGKTLTLDDTTGVVLLDQGGSIQGGVINTIDGNELRVLNQGLLDGVTLAGVLNLSQGVVGFGVRLTIKNGITLNNGLIRIGVGNNVIFSGSQTLGGNGSVLFADNTASNAISVPSSGTTLTIGPDITVHGKTGKIDAANAAILNQGTIAADGGGTLTVRGISNVSNGALSGGNWQVIGNSTLSLVGADISTNAADILIDGANARLVKDDVGSEALAGLRANTDTGRITLHNGARLFLPDSVSNAGDVTIGTGSVLHGGISGHQFANTVLGFSSQFGTADWAATQALGAPNTFSYRDSAFTWAPLAKNGTREFLTLGFSSPVIAEGITIRETWGNGFVDQVDVLDMDDVLHTVWTGVDPSQPGSPVDFDIHWAATSYLVKGVKIYVNTSHDLNAWEEIDSVTLLSPGTQGKYTQTAGTTRLENGRLEFPETVDIQGGVLSGTGTIQGNLRNASVLDPGNPAGILAVTGNYTQTPAGSLNLGIGGTTTGSQYDRLDVKGNALLDGTLNINLADGFGPSFGQRFQVMSYAASTGDFAAVTGLKLGYKTIFGIDRSPTALTLTALENASDLAFTGMTIPPTATLGDNITVSYTISNLQDTPATGDWYDSIYLSSSPILDESAQLLGRVRHAGDVAGGGGYTGSLTAALPTLGQGNFHVIVLVDSRGAIADLNRQNNLGVSTGVISLSVPTLTLGTAVTGTIAVGQDIYYRLVVPPGDDINIKAGFPEASEAEFYVRYRMVPDRTNFDQMAPDLNELQPILSVANPQGGDYYILLHGREGAGGGQTFSLRADTASFGISSYSPGGGSNQGDVTTTLAGSRFTPQTTVSLTDVTGRVYANAEVTFVDSQHLHATFHLLTDKVPVGDFNLRATENGETVTAASLFPVTSELPGSLDMTIIAPRYVHIAEPIGVTINLHNNGGTDITAPLLIVTASQVEEGQEHNEFFSLPKEKLPDVVLPPHFDGGIGITYNPKPEAAGVTSKFDLSVANPSKILLNWDDLKTGLRPADVRDEAWDAVWGNFRPNVGNTLEDLYSLLRDDAKYLRRVGDFTNSIDDLLRFELEKAADDLPVQPAAGGVDLALPATGFPLVYGRSFSSSLFDHFRPGRLGIGWTDSFDISATTDSRGLITIRGGNTVRFFGKSPTGAYVGFPGEQASLTVVNGGFQLRETDGSMTVFRLGGALDYIQDTHNNRMMASYTGSRLEKVTHTDGSELSFTYNDAGFVDQVIDSTGRMVTYAYDSSGHLTSVTTVSGTTSYTYTPETLGPLAHAITSITSPSGNHLFFKYDSQGRLASQKGDEGANPLTFIYGPNSYSVTDGLGKTTSVFFDNLGRPVVTIDPLGRIGQSGYDHNNQLAATGISGGGLGTIRYDPRGNPDLQVNPLGEIQSFAYDPAFNRLTQWTDSLGNTAVYEIDDRGNRVQTTYPDGSTRQFGYDTQGNLTQTVTRGGQAITFTYDDHGSLLQKAFTDGTHVDYTHDARGNLTSVTDANGTISLKYDDADRLTKISYPSGRFLQYRYDAGGRRTGVEDQSGFAERYTYDAAGRLAGVQDGNGIPVVSYVYDAAGQLARESRGNGTYTTYDYDAAGQLSHLVHFAPDNTVQSRFDYTYDRLGRQNSVTTLEGTTGYSYDGVGRLTGVGLPNGRTIAYQYDAAGNRVAVTDNGAVTGYATNNLNQYTRIGAGSYVYDLDGNLTSGAGNSYNYDVEGRLLSVAGPGGTWTYQYDALGNRIAMSHNGQTIQYLIDPSGLGNVFGEYDGSGDLIAHYTQGFGLASRVDASGQSAYYGFDASGNTSQLTGAGGAILNRYSYLPFGETLAASESVPNTFEFGGALGVQADGSGLDYMRARFYAPDQGRFIQVDPIELVGGTNFYSYAQNNPISYSDPSGLVVIPPALVPFLPTLSPLAPTLTPIAESVEISKALGQAFNASNPQFIQGANNILAEFGEAPGAQLVAKATGQVAGDAAVQGAATGAEFGIEAGATAAAGGGAGAGALAGLPEALIFTGLGVFYWSAGSLLFAHQYQAATGHIPICPDWMPDWLQFITACENTHELFAGKTQHVSGTLTTQVGAHDPNEISGPAGFGPEEFIRPDVLFPYAVYFENDPNATAPAQQVIVTEQLDSNLDWSTFRLGNFGFGDINVEVPEDRQFYSTRLDERSTLGLFVDVTAGLDAATGVITWTLTSLDPQTLDIPANPLSGFLPPNDGTHRGEGFASYFIRPKTTTSSGTAINAQATVVFDTEDPIDTPRFTNTIDAEGPVSLVSSLPPTGTATSFTVSWPGNDGAGSGIASYDIFVSRDGGAFESFLQETTDISAVFQGEVGHSYGFYSVATDNVGRREAAPDTADATTQVVPVGNTLPLARDDAATIAEDTPVRIAVLENDTDMDGDLFTPLLVSGPVHGTLVFNGDLTVTYTPAKNFNGVDVFTYKINDGMADSNIAMVKLTISPVNDAPMAIGDEYSTDEDSPLTITAPGVLFNDSDVENDLLTAVLVAAPGHGVLALDAKGAFTYTPNLNYHGTDSFSYKANDGSLDSNLATVSLTINPVNDAPQGTSATLNTLEDTSRIFKASDFGFSDPNDTPANGFKSVIIDSLPMAGTLTLNNLAVTAGTIVLSSDLDAKALVFTPAANANGLGIGQLTFRVQDDGGTANGGVDTDSTAKTLTFDVTLANDKPTADTVNNQHVPEGQMVNLAVTGHDVDGDTLHYQLLSGPAASGVNPDSGQFTWTATDGDAVYPVGVRVSDGVADSFFDVFFDIIVTNVAPTLTVTGNTTAQGGQPYTLNLSATDPGQDTVSGWQIDWGDGVTEAFTGNPSSVQHSYGLAGGNFTIQAEVTDEDGTYQADPFSVQVTPDILPETLKVTAFKPTASGFKVRFNTPFDPSVINLYDAADRAQGAADITIQGSLMGAIKGSLVIDPDQTGFSFIRTGGLLAPDTYQVVLTSGASAFHNSVVGALDGNADGTPGDAYTTTFTATAPGSGYLNLPDFMRGPGQAVDVPATAQGLPLTFQSPGNVSSLEFTVNYNPAYLDITVVTAGANLPNDVMISTDLSQPGQARFTIISPNTPLADGKLNLLNLTAKVPDSARYGAKEIIDLTLVKVNGNDVQSLDDDALHVVGYFGDASGNAQYTTLDVERIQRLVVKLDSGFSAWSQVDPLIIADINASGGITSKDAAYVYQELSGNDRLEIPAIPAGIGPIVFNGPDPLASVPQNLTAQAGSRITVPVNLDIAAGLESVLLSLNYDDSALQLLTVNRGSLTQDFQPIVIDLDGAWDDGKGDDKAGKRAKASRWQAAFVKESAATQQNSNLDIKITAASLQTGSSGKRG